LREQARQLPPPSEPPAQRMLPNAPTPSMIPPAVIPDEPGSPTVTAPDGLAPLGPARPPLSPRP
jgi:hypothetical protein